MTKFAPRSFSIVAALVLSAGLASAQTGTSSLAVTGPTGTTLEQSFAPGDDSGAFNSRGTSWTFADATAIASTVAFSEPANSLWVGQWLNSPRVQRFDITGDGTPLVNYAAPAGSLTSVSAAKGADLAAVLNSSGSTYSVTAYSKASGFKWTYAFPSSLNNSGYYNIKVSRDGSVVACILTDTTDSANPVPSLYIFNGATGAIQNTWPLATGYAGGVDLTDNGSLALVTVNDQARLIDSATGAVITSASVVGSGGRFAISGNGQTFALGGFDFKVFKKVGSSYVPAVNFSAATSWFGWAIAISRDGSTVGVLSHNYNGYLKTATRVFDVASGTLLGTVNTTGTGTLQDSAVGASISDDGSVLAVASWGTQNNAHPEVQVFSRTLAALGSIDTPGSPSWVDVSSDGKYVAVGGKAVHANTFGNGGYVDVIGLRCPSDFNGDGFVNADDFDGFVDAFVLGNIVADFNNDGFVNADDYDAYVDAFAAGC